RMHVPQWNADERGRRAIVRIGESVRIRAGAATYGMQLVRYLFFFSGVDDNIAEDVMHGGAVGDAGAVAAADLAFDVLVDHRRGGVVRNVCNDGNIRFDAFGDHFRAAEPTSSCTAFTMYRPKGRRCLFSFRRRATSAIMNPPMRLS